MIDHLHHGFTGVDDLQDALDALAPTVDLDTRSKLRPLRTTPIALIATLSTRLKDVLGEASFNQPLPLVFSGDHTPPAYCSIDAQRVPTAARAREAAHDHFSVGNDQGRIQLGFCLHIPPGRSFFYAWRERRAEHRYEPQPGGLAPNAP